MTTNRRSDTGLISSAILFGFVTVCAIGTIGPNFMLALIAATTLAGGFLLLWRPNESPILLVIFLFQWLQASVAILRASFLNVEVSDLYDFQAPFNEAIILTHVALICLAIGMKVAAGARSAKTIYSVSKTLRDYPLSYWFRLYVIFWFVGAAATFGQQAIPGLSQVFLGVIDLRWAFYFMLAAAFFSRPKSDGVWFLGAFGFELVMGLGGYFSDFKTVFIVTFLAVVAAGARITPKWILPIAGIVLGAIYLGIMWTAVKPDYRAFVSGGSGQVVNVGYVERMQKLTQLAQNVDGEEFSESAQDFAERLSYIKFFGATLEHVPTYVPHEDGALTLDAISRPFMPRVFFPDKAIIDDSVRTAKYTGLEISGRERGTSISLGWVSEVYIDFGSYFMMLAAFALGLFYGGIQRLMLSWSIVSPLLGMACSTAILINAILLETSITKVTGGLIASLIATVLVIRFVVPIVAPALVNRR